ncbi:dynamin family protein [Gordonia insulae]|uniref:Isoniazid-induced protein IniA n=1 Tax=Gordonia insulae TaxID=2420509 RepID=A0A3G8JQY5_9ACTN|nr:dynamin family protein [Gordonia insulae]AZG46872.1 Isoniazid-induced protein IniA [Gordonia insulae]
MGETPASQGVASGRAPDDGAARVVDGSVKVLRAYQMDALADVALDKLNRVEQPRTVVVVGEVQRGKSSLVNALIGQRDLCPAGVDVTSSVSVGVTPDPTLEADSTAELYFPSGARPVPSADLAEWVTIGGAMVRDPQVDELPTAAAIAVREGRMSDVTLVDTPGVGGLDVGLATRAAQSAQQACVLVLVCDASSPITAPEMAFVRESAATVDSVVVAVTKTDKNLRRWREIVAEDERLLAEQLRRPVTVIGVSSLLAVMAAESADPAIRDRLESESGIGALRAEIDRRLDAASTLPHVDAVRTCLEGLRVVRGRVTRELAAVEAGARALPDLTADMERLTELQEQSRQWEQYLARDLTLLRQSAIDDLERRLDDVRDKWTTFINTHGMEVLRRSAQKFTADMQTDLQLAMAETLSGFLQRLHDTIIEPRFRDDPTVWEELSSRIVASMQDKKIETHQVGSKRHGLLDPTLLTMGVIGSSTLGGLLGLSALMGVGVVVGTAWVGINLSFRAIRAGKSNLLTWLRETIATTKAATGRLVESAVAQSRPEIVIRYREYLRTNIDTLQKTIGEVQKAASADAAAREKSTQRLTTNLEIVDKRIVAAERLLAGGRP